MNVLYRWKMRVGGNTYDIHPVYKDDLSLNYERETGQQFFRAKLSSKITLVAKDAQLVINAAFSTEFIITIQKSADQGLTWSDYYTCHFFKTDCTINEDDLQVSVQPTVKDRYEVVLNGMEKEYNLVELAPAIEPVKAAKRPMLQIFVDGDTIVSCICGGNYFEVDHIGGNTPGNCHFAGFPAMWEINISNAYLGFTTPFTGIFNGYGYEGSQFFYNADNIYYIEYFEQHVPSEQYGTFYTNGLYVRRVSDDEILWSFTQMSINYIQPIGPSLTIDHVPEYSYLPQLTGSLSDINVYARYVMDVPGAEIGGQYEQFYEIESDDIVANNRNYNYCRGYSSIDIRQSTRYSDTPTKWGRNDNGQYFLPPDDEDEWYPVGQSQWVNTSSWIKYDAGMRQFEQLTTKEYVIRDCYPLWSVINVILRKIAPNITMEGSSTYSHFFYDDTQIGNPADWLRNTRCFLCQKSNVLIGEYKEPAQKAMVKLKDVTEMLKKVFGCYWYIDSDNHFCVEHLQWFKNGGSYGSSPVIGYDLTQLINLPNGKPWAFGTSEYQFDKENMPARYQYEWMDKSTELFNGDAINVLSRFVQEDKVEEVTVANFTSDIDYMLLAGENCSKDGFALFQVVPDGNIWKLPYQTFHREQYQYRLQNYIVAMVYLQDKFLTYDMPSWTLEINDEQVQAKGIQRNKKQTLAFPIGENDPELDKLVKTNIGNGQYDKVQINLSSRQSKTTLKYNTYDV